MALNLAHIGAKAKEVVPLDRLLENVGILSRGPRASATEGDVPADEGAPDETPEGAVESAVKQKPQKSTYGASEHIPVAARVAAWWKGDTISRRAAAKSAAEVENVVPVDMTSWGPERLKLVQALWGESFLEPGGANRTRKLFSHVMPNSKQSVVDLTAGLGGTAFTLAQDQGLWMDAMEPIADLAAEALKSASISGLGAQVPVSHINIDAIDVPKNKYHLAYTRERLFAMSQKLEVLTSAAGGLKDGGTLVITDLMVPNSEIMDTEGYREWASTEPFLPQPWTMALYAKSLEDLGLKVAGRQNSTQDYLDDIHAGWTRITRDLKKGEFDRSLENYLLAEGELWAARSKVLVDGVISHCRIIARRVI